MVLYKNKENKTMKKFFIAATALILITGSLQAQHTKGNAAQRHHRGAYSHKGGMHTLNLNDEQKKQFKNISESYHKQIKDLHDNKSLTADDVKNKTEALRKEQHEKMQSLLTPEQRTQMAAQRKNNEKGQGKNFDQVKAKLGLSDDQAIKLKANREDFHNKVTAIRSDNSLSDSQKKDQVKALAKQQKENMKTLLTPEQIEKMKSAKKGKFGSK